MNWTGCGKGLGTAAGRALHGHSPARLRPWTAQWGPDPVRDIDELIFLMPAQVGAQIACDALDRLAPRLTAGGIKVTCWALFKARPGSIPAST